MALSNIVREPRREITESAIGIGALFIFLYADYHFALWFYTTTGGGNQGCPWLIGMVLGCVLTVILVAFLFMTHWIGEGICGFLARLGVELRPKDRRR